MRGVATDIGTIHFIGIGGIGMSGRRKQPRLSGAGQRHRRRVCHRRPAQTRHRVAIGHDATNVDGVAWSSPRPRSSAAIRGRGARAALPLVRRAEMLAELMRLKSTVAIAGTHGKTTTTSLVAALLDAGGIDPTVINGGIINNYGSNARLGASDWMVVEADESDGSFLRLDGTIAVVTNIDPEHLDHYGSFDAIKDAFVEFIENVPFYGAAMLCLDHPEVQAIIPRIRDRRIVTYGFSAQADVRGTNVTPGSDGNRFDVVVAATATGATGRSRVSTCRCRVATMCKLARRDCSRAAHGGERPRVGLQRLCRGKALHQGWRIAVAGGVIR